MVKKQMVEVGGNKKNVWREAPATNPNTSSPQKKFIVHISLGQTDFVILVTL